MTPEFPGRFRRLFTGPMWSGQDRKNVGYTQKEEAILKLKEANPDGRFWLKLDGTDVKTALMESVKGMWNGDADIGDETLQITRKEYDERTESANLFNDKNQDRDMLKNRLIACINKISDDISFLNKNFTSAVKIYKENYDAPNTSVKTLKDSNWNVVEFQMLLPEAQQIKSTFEICSRVMNADDCGKKQVDLCRAMIKESTVSVQTYLRNLFKKNRVAASHVEVMMVSDEKRNSKTYALPVKFVPCQTLRDQ